MITLEQWAALSALKKEGSVQAAAAALNKSQSAVSYLLNKVNKQLPSPIFVQQGRQLQFTELGLQIIKRAERLLKEATDMEKLAQQYSQGVLLELSIAIDATFPSQVLLSALKTLAIKLPQVQIKLLETNLSGTDEALLSGQADLVLSPSVPASFLGQPLFDMRFLAVAHFTHTLQQHSQTISDDELRLHRQVVLRDSGTKRSQDKGWLGSNNRWTVSNFASSLQMVMAGLAFAWLPYDLIKTPLKQKQLQQLNLAQGQERLIPQYLIYRAPKDGNVAVKTLGKLIEMAAKEYRLSLNSTH